MMAPSSPVAASSTPPALIVSLLLFALACVFIEFYLYYAAFHSTLPTLHHPRSLLITLPCLGRTGEDKNNDDASQDDKEDDDPAPKMPICTGPRSSFSCDCRNSQWDCASGFGAARFCQLASGVCAVDMEGQPRCVSDIVNNCTPCQSSADCHQRFVCVWLGDTSETVCQYELGCLTPGAACLPVFE